MRATGEWTRGAGVALGSFVQLDGLATVIFPLQYQAEKIWVLLSFQTAQPEKFWATLKLFGN